VRATACIHGLTIASGKGTGLGRARNSFRDALEAPLPPIAGAHTTRGATTDPFG
jgi:hypothetical protein